jgi:hypothetical protein
MELRHRIQIFSGLLFVALLASACATQPRVNWDARIGQYSYDEAVLELGPPDRASQLTDGTLVAEWLRSRSRGGLSLGVGAGVGGGNVGVFGGPTIGTRQAARFLRLTFAPDGQLLAWNQVNR